MLVRKQKKGNFIVAFRRVGIFIVNAYTGYHHDSFLKEIDISVMYVVGKEKADVLKKVVTENTPRHIFPVSVIREMKKIFLFTGIAWQKNI